MKWYNLTQLFPTLELLTRSKSSFNRSEEEVNRSCNDWRHFYFLTILYCKTLFPSPRSLLIFVPLRMFGLYRIDADLELKGNDLAKHGEAAYPAEAWAGEEATSNASELHSRAGMCGWHGCNVTKIICKCVYSPGPSSTIK